MRAFLYKPAPLRLTTTETTGGKRYWRLVPKVVDAGVLLQPVLKDTAAFEAFMRGERGASLTEVTVEVLPRDLRYWSTLELEIEAERESTDVVSLRAR